MPDLQTSLGWRYFQDTFLGKRIGGKKWPAIAPVSPFKEYEEAKNIPLPRDMEERSDSLWSALQGRRSERRYGKNSITLDELALLLWAAQGVTARMGDYHLRTAPSAGALYPIETYVAAERVESIPAGLFHFNVRRFSLERLSDGGRGEAIAEAALGQSFLARGAAIFLWSAVFRRNMAKYGDRGLRYILMDAGHVCQNLLLAAEALKLKSCPVAAFLDEEMNRLLGLDGEEEAVVYLAVVGRGD